MSMYKNEFWLYYIFEIRLKYSCITQWLAKKFKMGKGVIFSQKFRGIAIKKKDQLYKFDYKL